MFPVTGRRAATLLFVIGAFVPTAFAVPADTADSAPATDAPTPEP